MKYLLCLTTLAVCAYAQLEMTGPEHSSQLEQIVMRHRRDVKDLQWDKQVGENGQIFGKLGQDTSGLYGKAGYNHQLFNDDRGKMNAQAYGSRVLGPSGDSTNFGGRLDWADKNAKAALDVSRPIGGHTGISATADGIWNLDKNTRVSAGGFYNQEHLGHGKPDYGFMTKFQKDF